MLGFLQPIQDKLIALVLPLILAPIVTFLVNASKRYSAWLDGQHAVVKQALAALYAMGLAALATAVGKSVCADGSAICEITQLDWKGVLTWAFALALHGWRKKPQG